MLFTEALSSVYLVCKKTFISSQGSSPYSLASCSDSKTATEGFRLWLHGLVHLLQLLERGCKSCITLFESINFVIYEVVLDACLVLWLNQAIDCGASSPTCCHLLLNRHYSLRGQSLRHNWRLSQRGQSSRCVLIPIRARWNAC